MLGILAVIKPLVDLLTSVGIIKTPEQQAQIQQQMAEAAAQADQSFADFVRATQPTGVVVAGIPWYVNLIGALQNFTVALVRPSISLFAAYRVYFFPHDYSTPLYLIPVLFWFTGRTVEKIMSASGFPASDFAPAPAPTPVPSKPTPPPLSIDAFKQAHPELYPDHG